MLITSTEPEPPLESNVIVAGTRAGIDTVAVATTDAPVHEPFDDFTLPFIVAVVAVAPLLNVFVLALTQVTVFPSPSTVLHEPVYDVPLMLSVPEYDALTVELMFTYRVALYVIVVGVSADTL